MLLFPLQSFAAPETSVTQDIALRQILEEKAAPEAKSKALFHEQGCVLNYLEYGGFDGWVPIWGVSNYLVLNMVVWREGGTPVEEF